MNYVLLSGAGVGWRSRVLLEQFQSLLLPLLRSEDQLTLWDLKTHPVIFSDGRNYLDYPGDTGRLTQLIMGADVLVLSTPTFQASIPATLKNVFDLLPQDALRHKTVAILSTAGSNKHFLVAETQLKPILSYMKADIIRSVVFALDTDFANGELMSADVRMRLKSMADELVAQVQVFAAIHQAQADAFDF